MKEPECGEGPEAKEKFEEAMKTLFQAPKPKPKQKGEGPTTLRKPKASDKD